MSLKARVAKLEKGTGARKEKVKAFVVLFPENELTPESEVYYWKQNEKITLTLEEFREQFPESELVKIRVVYEKKELPHECE